MKRIECCASEHERNEILPRIVFGIHPEVVEKIGKPVVVISETFYFCRLHWLAHRKECLLIITKVYGGNIEELSHVSELKEGLGCWITLAGLGGDNFQLPYEVFEKIYRQFTRTVRRVR